MDFIAHTEKSTVQPDDTVDMKSDDGQEYFSDGAPANDADINSDDWIPLTKTAKIRKTSGVSASVATHNRFESLSQNDDDDDEKLSKSTKNTKKAKPPPIYVYGVQNKFQFSRTLAAVCRTKPRIYHTQQQVRFQTNSYADYEELKTYYNQQKYQFATELPNLERPFKVVMRKLPIDTPT